METSRPHAGPPRGILNPAVARQKIVLTRQLPAEPLRALVEHYWIVRWDLRGEAPHTQETLPHPSVHWVTGGGRSSIIGIMTGRFTRQLEGRSRVVGVKFKPGGFHPFWRAAGGTTVSQLADREIAPCEAFGSESAEIERELLSLDAAWHGAAEAGEAEAEADAGADAASDANNEQMMSLLDRFLLARLPPHDPQVDAVCAIAEGIMADRDIIKVDDVVSRWSINKRTLQRLFNQYVGVSPKWVIKRYRLHEAVERVAAGEVVNWSQLAADLGYFDQTHFIKDFKALIGKSPAEYARSAINARA